MIREGFLEEVSLQLNPEVQQEIVRQRSRMGKGAKMRRLIQRTLGNELVFVAAVHDGSWSPERWAGAGPRMFLTPRQAVWRLSCRW